MENNIHHADGGVRRECAGRRTGVARPAGSLLTNSGPTDSQDRPHRPARRITSARSRRAGWGRDLQRHPPPQNRGAGAAVGTRGGWAGAPGGRRGWRGIGCEERGDPIGRSEQWSAAPSPKSAGSLRGWGRASGLDPESAALRCLLDFGAASRARPSAEMGTWGVQGTSPMNAPFHN